MLNFPAVAALVVTLNVNAFPVLPAVADVGVTAIDSGCLTANAPELTTANTAAVMTTSNPSPRIDRRYGRLLHRDPPSTARDRANRRPLISFPSPAGHPAAALTGPLSV